METYYKYFILIYFIIYFGIAFVAKTIIVARRIGKNPLVLPKDDSAYGLIGRYFKFTLIGIFIYVIYYAIVPSGSGYSITTFRSLNYAAVKFAGISILAIALVWTIIAQSHMKDSWRIGIDEETKTELITSGFFRYSRNPIFFGMIMSLVGLFLLTPNTATLFFLILAYVLIQVQVRLEEEFLKLQHQETYIHYFHTVRRFI